MKSNSMSLDSIAEMLSTTGGKKSNRIYWKASIQFEDELLLDKVIPAEYFDFFIQLITSPKHAEQNGLAHFVAGIATDFCKLNSEQMAILLKVIISNSGIYSNELVSFSLADLVSRKYDFDKALLAFESIHKYGTKNGDRLVKNGCKMLMSKVNVGDVLYKRLSDLIGKLG